MRRRGARLLAALAALALAASPLAAQTPPAKPRRAGRAARRRRRPSRRRPTNPSCCVWPKSSARSLICAISAARATARRFAPSSPACWRRKGTPPARKETLAGAFNRGFRDYELTYRACTPAAREIVARFLDEAARIAKDVANRYAG